MANREEPRAPRPQAPLPAAGDPPGSGPGKLRLEPQRSAAGGGSAAPERPGRGRTERAPPTRPPPGSAGLARPAGGLGALAARGAWVPARAPGALVFPSSVPSPFPSSFYFWPPPPLPPPSLVPSSSAFHLPAQLPGREGAAAAGRGGGDAGGGGGPEAAPLSVPPGGSPRGGGGSGGRRLLLSPALLGLLLPARAGPRLPPPPRLPLGPSARRAGSAGFPGPGGHRSGLGPSAGGGGQTPRRPGGAGFALAAAAPLRFGSDMEDGPSNHTSCFRRLTECFLSPSKCCSPLPAGAGGAPAGFSRGARAGRAGAPAGAGPWSSQAPRARGTG